MGRVTYALRSVPHVVAGNDGGCSETDNPLGGVPDRNIVKQIRGLLLRIEHTKQDPSAAPESLSTLYSELAAMYYDLGDFNRAVKVTDDQIAAAATLRNRNKRLRLMCSAHERKGNIYRELAQYTHAIAEYRRNHSCAEQLGDQVELLQTIFELGVCHMLRYESDDPQSGNMQDLELSEKYYLTAISKLLSPETQNVIEKQRIIQFKADLNMNCGLVKMHMGKYDLAIRHISAARNIYEKISQGEGVANAFRNLSLCYQQMGNIKEALKMAECELDAQRKLPDISGPLDPLFTIADLAKRLFRFQYSIKCLREVVSVCETIGLRGKRNIARREIDAVQQATVIHANLLKLSASIDKEINSVPVITTNTSHGHSHDSNSNNNNNSGNNNNNVNNNDNNNNNRNGTNRFALPPIRTFDQVTGLVLDSNTPSMIADRAMACIRPRNVLNLLEQRAECLAELDQHEKAAFDHEVRLLLAQKLSIAPLAIAYIRADLGKQLFLAEKYPLAERTISDAIKQFHKEANVQADKGNSALLLAGDSEFKGSRQANMLLPMQRLEMSLLSMLATAVIKNNQGGSAFERVSRVYKSMLSIAENLGDLHNQSVALTELVELCKRVDRKIEMDMYKTKLSQVKSLILASGMDASSSQTLGEQSTSAPDSEQFPATGKISNADDTTNDYANTGKPATQSSQQHTLFGGSQNVRAVNAGLCRKTMDEMRKAKAAKNAAEIKDVIDIESSSSDEDPIPLRMARNKYGSAARILDSQDASSGQEISFPNPVATSTPAKKKRQSRGDVDNDENVILQIGLESGVESGDLLSDDSDDEKTEIGIVPYRNAESMLRSDNVVEPTTQSKPDLRSSSLSPPRKPSNSGDRNFSDSSSGSSSIGRVNSRRRSRISPDFECKQELNEPHVESVEPKEFTESNCDNIDLMIRPKSESPTDKHVKEVLGGNVAGTSRMGKRRAPSPTFSEKSLSSTSSLLSSSSLSLSDASSSSVSANSFVGDFNSATKQKHVLPKLNMEHVDEPTPDKVKVRVEIVKSMKPIGTSKCGKIPAIELKTTFPEESEKSTTPAVVPMELSKSVEANRIAELPQDTVTVGRPRRQASVRACATIASLSKLSADNPTESFFRDESPVSSQQDVDDTTSTHNAVESDMVPNVPACKQMEEDTAEKVDSDDDISLSMLRPKLQNVGPPRRKHLHAVLSPIKPVTPSASRRQSSIGTGSKRVKTAAEPVSVAADGDDVATAVIPAAPDTPTKDSVSRRPRTPELRRRVYGRGAVVTIARLRL